MLLASAVARAGQVESIPAPSAGSPEQAGRRLPPLEEGVPLSRAMLSPSYVMSPRQDAGGSRRGIGGSFVEVGDDAVVAAAAAAAAGASAAARSRSTVASMPPLPAARPSPAKVEEVEEIEEEEKEEVGGQSAGQKQSLLSPRDGGGRGRQGFVAREVGRLEAEARLGLEHEPPESELGGKTAVSKDNGLSLGDLESIFADPMPVKDQTPPLSLGRSPLEQAPATAAAAAETSPEKPSGFSLRNAFSAFLGMKKGSGSGTCSDSTDRKEDSAAGSSCGEAIGDAPNAFNNDGGVRDAPSEYGERAVAEKEGEGDEEMAVGSPLRSSLDELPGLVLPTPEDGESLFSEGGFS